MIIAFACSCTPTPVSRAAIPVFPGAAGFGTLTPAGRGGRIIKVTNLEGSGPGSLRAAIESPGPRIIVFETSGTISLRKYLVIKQPYVTIAGQTAPSPGITIRGAGIRVSTHDVLIQHLRIRVGDDPDGPNENDRDCIQLKKSDSIYNIVIDHISASWAVDENISTWGAPHDVTLSHSIVSEALKNSLEGSHQRGYGLLVGDHSKNIAVIQNLFAHNRGRNPLLKGDTTSVVLNNLIYNAGPYYFGYMADDYKSGPSKASLVGNVVIEGQNSNSAPGFVLRKGIGETSKVYLQDNAYVGKNEFFKSELLFSPLTATPPVWHPSLVPISSSCVEEAVISNSGARPADRDLVDLRIVDEISRRTGKQIDSQEKVGGWPKLTQIFRRFKVPDGYDKDADGNGYTRIEEILHQMAAELERSPSCPP